MLSRKKPKKIISEFSKTKLYSKEFIKDIEKGMKRSSFSPNKMNVLPVHKDISDYLKKHNLEKKFSKQLNLF